MRLAQASLLYFLVAGGMAVAPAVPVAPKSKVLSLSTDADQKLASAIVTSRAQVRRSEAT